MPLCGWVLHRQIRKGEAMPSLTFLGAAGTVTGSKFLLESNGRRLLIDCGLFQGYKQLRLRNRKPLPFNPADLDGVVLTHAHLDHSGYLPVLTASGFGGPIYCTELTADLCHILLPDAARIQEFDAAHANRGGYSRHSPSKPLFTEKDARRALRQLNVCPMEVDLEPLQGVKLRFRPAGHIPGAATVDILSADRRIVFSGDLGRYNSPLHAPPLPVEVADYLVLESTYGNRTHPDTDPEKVLAGIIQETVARGGRVLIPSFAVGRAQLLLYHLSQLRRAGAIPDVQIYLDSPMAIEATELVCRKDMGTRLGLTEMRNVCSIAELVTDAEASERLIEDTRPKIVLSASGMATGGRVLNHLKRYAPDPRNTILFAGFQAGGTRGAHLVAGASEIKIHGAWHPVRASVHNLDMLSAHADASEIMRWLSGFKAPPRQTFIIHGEPDASDVLRQRIEETLGWAVTVPEQSERFELN